MSLASKKVRFLVQGFLHLAFNHKKHRGKLETEKELLCSINSGSREALRRLYERYVGYAMAVALRYVPVRDDAEDVVHDSFVKIFSCISGFDYRGEGALKGWVLRIVANEAVGFVRRKNRFQVVDDMPDTAVCDDALEPDVERVPPAELTRMIGELPDGYRMVLGMYVFERKSHKEIARLLGIKETTSASQYLRAKKLLARKVNDFLRRGGALEGGNNNINKGKRKI